jgi:predicted amidohydrolase YtcJ
MSQPAQAVPEGANLTIVNAAVFDGRQLVDADTIVVTDGLVTALGRGVDIPSGAEVVDARGGLVTPGFVDAHAHPVMAGVEALSLDVSDCGSADETLARVAHALGSGDGWVTGGGWSMSDFPGGAPTAAALDALAAGMGEAAEARPVCLISADHHSTWVNSAALRIAGIDRSTATPDGGVIERDAHGDPTGTLHEAAMDLVSAHIPPETPEELRSGLLEGQRRMHAVGVTGYNDAIVGAYAGHASAYDGYRQAEAAGELTIEVTGSLWWPRGLTEADVDEQVERLRELRVDGPKFRATNVKFMLDGIVESRTAAMHLPYRCECGGVGTSYFTRAHLERAFAGVQTAGFDIHCHAIGDQATRDALDTFETLRAGGVRPDTRHHIAHIQVVDPIDLPRFAALGVSANLQALWAHYDEQMVALNLPALGEDRAAWQYPFGTLAASGAHLAMGSDWPVTTPDPWQAIHVAVNRTHPTGARPEPLVAEQAIDLSTALTAYTSGSAHLGRTRTAGRLAVGAPADLALTSTNPFAGPIDQIHSVTNELTLAGGHLVHRAPADRTPTRGA